MANRSRRRPAKVLRINYWSNEPIHNAYIGTWGSPAEVKMGVGSDTFISLNQNGISLSAGVGKKFNVQAMNLVYGGMLTDLPFPLSTIPITPFTPFPTQVFSPPLKELMDFLREVSTLALSFPAG